MEAESLSEGTWPHDQQLGLAKRLFVKQVKSQKSPKARSVLRAKKHKTNERKRTVDDDDDGVRHRILVATIVGCSPNKRCCGLPQFRFLV